MKAPPAAPARTASPRRARPRSRGASPPTARSPQPRQARVEPPRRSAPRCSADASGGPISLLLSRTRRRPLPLDTACRLLDTDPAGLRAIVAQAQTEGLELAVVQNHVVRAEAREGDALHDLGPAPAAGRRFWIGVLSDTHLGSQHCLRRELADFVRTAYRKGARHIVHAGDVLDGMYRHGLFELTHSGLEAQTRDLFETLPRLDGLTYHAIGGNHDDTFSDSAGLDAGRFVEQYFRAHGRDDYHHYGRRSAFLKLGGAIVHLWHPRSSCGYSAEYKVKQKLESYSPGQKPNVLLVGHWHRYVHTTARGIEGIACPTFQGGQSAFGRSLVGDPAIGGLLLSWTLTRHGAMRGFRLERRSYFEKEPLHDLGGFVPARSPLARSTVGASGEVGPTEKAPRAGGVAP